MSRPTRNNRSLPHGFTLLEMIIVLTLIAALLAMVLGLFVRRRLKKAPTPFGSTLEVLRKDREALTREES